MPEFIMTREMWEVQQESLAEIKARLTSIDNKLDAKPDEDDCGRKHKDLLEAWRKQYGAKDKRKIMPDTWVERFKWLAILSAIGLISGGSLLSLVREIGRYFK